MLHSTSSAVKTGSFPHIDRFVPFSQDLHSGENSFLHLLWLLNRPARASHLFGSENGVVGCFPHINRLAPASQEIHSCENCFLHLFWYLNRPARASQHLLGGKNGIVRCFAHINRLVPASQDFLIGENCFLHLYLFMWGRRRFKVFTLFTARWHHTDVCRLPCIASCSIGSNNIGRCISAVHIRRCSVEIRQQCLVAEWLGLSVTVRVRVRVRARAREWNPLLLFLSSSL